MRLIMNASRRYHPYPRGGGGGGDNVQITDLYKSTDPVNHLLHLIEIYSDVLTLLFGERRWCRIILSHALDVPKKLVDSDRILLQNCDGTKYFVCHLLAQFTNVKDPSYYCDKLLTQYDFVIRLRAIEFCSRVGLRASPLIWTKHSLHRVCDIFVAYLTRVIPQCTGGEDDIILPPNISEMKSLAYITRPRCTSLDQDKRFIMGYSMSSEHYSFLHKQSLFAKQFLGYLYSNCTVTRAMHAETHSAESLTRVIRPCINIARRRAVDTLIEASLTNLSHRDLLFMLYAIGIICPIINCVANDLVLLDEKNYGEKLLTSHIETEEKKGIFKPRQYYADQCIMLQTDKDLIDLIAKIIKVRQSHEKNKPLVVCRRNCLCHTKCTRYCARDSIYEATVDNVLNHPHSGTLICGLCGISQTIKNTTAAKPREVFTSNNPGISACSKDGCPVRYYQESYILKRKKDIITRPLLVEYTHLFYSSNSSNAISALYENTLPSTFSKIFGVCFGGFRTCRVRPILTQKNKVNKVKSGLLTSTCHMIGPDFKWRRCSTCRDVPGFIYETNENWTEAIHRDSCVQLLCTRMFEIWKKYGKASDDEYVAYLKHMCLGCSASLRCVHASLGFELKIAALFRINYVYNNNSVLRARLCKLISKRDFIHHLQTILNSADIKTLNG